MTVNLNDYYEFYINLTTSVTPDDVTYNLVFLYQDTLVNNKTFHYP